MRLILAVAVGLVAWFVAPWRIAATTRALLGWDVAGLVLTGFTFFIILRSDSRETRRRAAAYDPGRRAVWVIMLVASTSSLLAAAAVLRQGHAGTPFSRTLHVALCVATVAISWLVTHSAFTLRYAHLFYRDGERGGGIDLPGGEPPDDLDFAYFAFTIGMCFQVSDAAVTDRLIRRTVLAHALISFTFNTVILAFSLNLLFSQFA